MAIVPSPTGFLRRPAQASVALAGALALTVLLVWAFGDWRIMASGGAQVPMAPATAWLMILLSGAVFLFLRWPSQRVTRVSMLLAVLGTTAFKPAGTVRHRFPDRTMADDDYGSSGVTCPSAVCHRCPRLPSYCAR